MNFTPITRFVSWWIYQWYCSNDVCYTLPSITKLVSSHVNNCQIYKNFTPIARFVSWWICQWYFDVFYTLPTITKLVSSNVNNCQICLNFTPITRFVSWWIYQWHWSNDVFYTTFHHEISFVSHKQQSNKFVTLHPSRDSSRLKTKAETLHQYVF